MSRPLVSVIVPAYNHARYLPDRLDSITRQEVEDMEIVLLDDASTDGSADLLRDFAAKDHRARLLAQRENSGSPYRQWERGLAAARGRFIWIAESDDLAEPGLLRCLLDPLLRDDCLVLAFCESKRIDHNGNELGLMRDFHIPAAERRKWEGDHKWGGREFCLGPMLWRNAIPNASAVVFRAEAAPFPINPLGLRLAADWWFWARMVYGAHLHYQAHPLNRFRWHEETVRSSTTPSRFLWEASRVRLAILEKFDAGITARHQVSSRARHDLIGVCHDLDLAERIFEIIRWTPIWSRHIRQQPRLWLKKMVKILAGWGNG